MDLGVVQTGIESWLNLTAVDVDNGSVPLPVEFGRSPSKVHTSPFVLCYRGPILKMGHDIPQYTYDEITDEYIQQMWGVREMVVRFSFRAFNQDWDKAARQYAEDWRIRVESDRSILELSDSAFLAIIETGELVDLDYEWSGRLVSQVEASCRFRLWGYERNASTDAGYIKSVHVVGEQTIITEESDTVTDEQGQPIIGNDDIMDFTVTTD